MNKNTKHNVVHSGIVSDKLARALECKSNMRKLHERVVEECQKADLAGTARPAGHSQSLYEHHREGKPHE